MAFVPEYRELFKVPRLYGAFMVIMLGGLAIWLAVWLYGEYEPA